MSILKEIIKDKQKELDLVKSNKTLFKQIFLEKNANIIWEIKLSSPKFDYSKQIDLKQVSCFYWDKKEIKAVSVLIDKAYFSWDVVRWYNFKKEYKKPIFFKEFVIEKRQIDGASYFWYDGILLLKRVLTIEKIIELIDYSNQKDIFPIIEIDNTKDLEEVLWLNLDFGIAVNCRDLLTMEIDRERHFQIYEKYKNKLDNRLTFAFSWIDNLEQVKEYKWKYNWVLIGTYFMKKMLYK